MQLQGDGYSPFDGENDGLSSHCLADAEEPAGEYEIYYTPDQVVVEAGMPHIRVSKEI